MATNSRFWTYEIIELGRHNLPSRVLEVGSLPESAATREFAKRLLEARSSHSYPSLRGRAKADGVRFFDVDGAERMCFTDPSERPPSKSER